jgi:hypothetical protein
LRESREATPLTERLAVRDWLLGGAEEHEPRPRAGSAGGVTEAGRRAAEAYAAEAAKRAAATSPADDILDDSAAFRAAAEKLQAKAPRPAAAAKSKKKKDAAAASKKEPPKKESKGKLSAQAAAQAATKEPMFDAVDEEFFAREAELWHAPPHDSFDDLEPTQPRGKRPPASRRDWFGLNKKK